MVTEGPQDDQRESYGGPLSVPKRHPKKGSNPRKSQEGPDGSKEGPILVPIKSKLGLPRKSCGSKGFQEDPKRRDPTQESSKRVLIVDRSIFRNHTFVQK